MAQPTRTIISTYTNPATQQPASGRIALYTLPAVWTDADGGEILAGGGTFEVTAGVLSQDLVVTDAPGVEPATGRYWVYEERLEGLPYRRRVFELPEGDGSPIKVAALIDADPGQAGYTPVEGPAGPAGPAGPPGDTGPQPPLGAAGDGANVALRSTDPTTTNARTPTAHASSHASGGTDPVTPAAIGAAAASAFTTHTGATTSVHGIADTTALETTVGAASKVSTHAAASDPHGDRAHAAATYVPLSSILTAVKLSDEPIPSSTALQDDDHLVLNVVAGARYAIDAYLDVEADPAADITLGWSIPAGASLSWTETGISAGNTGNIGSIKQSRLDAVTSSGVGIVATGSAVRPSGSLVTAGTGGQLRLRWAQSVSSVTPTVLKAGSWIRATRLA